MLNLTRYMGVTAPNLPIPFMAASQPMPISRLVSGRFALYANNSQLSFGPKRRFTNESQKNPERSDSGEEQTGRSKFSQYRKILLLSSGIAFGIYVRDRIKKSHIEWTDVAFTHNSGIPLLFTSQEHLTKQLFHAVDEGDFAKAMFLINEGEVDVNKEKLIFDTSWVLTEYFYPKTSEDLENFMVFINFIISKGYRHLNRPIYDKVNPIQGEGDYNLISNIYNRHMFCDNPDLRRKLLGFFLEKA